MERSRVRIAAVPAARIAILRFAAAIVSAAALLLLPPEAGWELPLAAGTLAYGAAALFLPVGPAVAWALVLLDAVLAAAWIGATGGPRSEFVALGVLALVGAVAALGGRAVLAPAAILAAAHLFVGANVGLLGRSAAQALGLLAVAFALRSFAPAAPSEQEAIERELEALRDIDRAKTRFLNTASHELNTPLTPLKLQVHLLKSGSFGELNEKQERAVKVLDRNVERLSVLVQDILDVARLQSDGMRFDFRKTDLDKVVAEAVETFRDPAAHMGVRLEFRAGRPEEVVADPYRLTQVVYNLIGNALKFTPEGGAVRVETRGDGTVASVRVSDTGVGMDADQMARIFQPFVQVHDTATKGHRGTGLGLFISRSIVEAHRGRIHVESPGRGKGTTFTFELPLAATGALQPSAAQPNATAPLTGRMRELI